MKEREFKERIYKAIQDNIVLKIEGPIRISKAVEAVCDVVNQSRWIDVRNELPKHKPNEA